MITSGLAIFYAADISNIQYRPDLKMSPFESLYGTKPDVSKCQPFSIEFGLYVRADQRQDRNSMIEGSPRFTVEDQKIYYG